MDLALTKDISLLLNGVGFGNCLLLAFLYYCKPGRRSTTSFKILAFLFLVLACIILNTVISLSGYHHYFSFFETISNALAFSIAPLLYLFIGCIAERETRVNPWHFSLSCLYIIISLFLDALTGIIVTKDFSQMINESFRILWNVHFLVYLVLIFNRLNHGRISLSRMDQLLILGVSSIWIINLGLYVLSNLVVPLPALLIHNITLLFTGIALWITYQSLTVKELNRSYHTSPTKKPDYIVQLILENKLYRNPDLNVRSLSSRVGLPYYELSTTINQVYNQNFNQFINSFRINEVINGLKNSQLETYSVMGLAQKAGFRSGSAFYAAFKKETGTTPMAFIAKQKDPA